MGKLNLKSILSTYERTLCDKTFTYELNGKWNINLIFYREHFCHLAGLQYVYGRDKRFLGANGYRRIAENKLTIDSIRNHNEKGFNYIKGKLEFFDKIYDLLINGSAIKFYADRAKPHTIIVADFLFYHKDKEMLLHLFMRRENEKTEQFAPVSFIVKSPNDKSYQQYIMGQERKTITKFEVLDNNM